MAERSVIGDIQRVWSLGSNEKICVCAGPGVRNIWVCILARCLLAVHLSVSFSFLTYKIGVMIESTSRVVGK